MNYKVFRMNISYNVKIPSIFCIKPLTFGKFSNRSLNYENLTFVLFKSPTRCLPFEVPTQK